MGAVGSDVFLFVARSTNVAASFAWSALMQTRPFGRQTQIDTGARGAASLYSSA